MNDPLAIDSRGWNPRRYCDMTWESEPMFACIATPGVTKRGAILREARRHDHYGIIGDARWIALRVRVRYYRWAALEVVEHYAEERRDECPCHRWRPAPLVDGKLDPFYHGVTSLCPGNAMCGWETSVDIDDIWDEEGNNCPWMNCDKAHPMAVKWWVVWDSDGSDGPA